MTEFITFTWKTVTSPPAVLLHLFYWFVWTFVMWISGADLW